MSKIHEQKFHQKRKMANKHMKRYSPPLANQKIQIKSQEVTTTHLSK